MTTFKSLEASGSTIAIGIRFNRFTDCKYLDTAAVTPILLIDFPEAASENTNNMTHITLSSHRRNISSFITVATSTTTTTKCQLFRQTPQQLHASYPQLYSTISRGGGGRNFSSSSGSIMCRHPKIIRNKNIMSLSLFHSGTVEISHGITTEMFDNRGRHYMNQFDGAIRRCYTTESAAVAENQANDNSSSSSSVSSTTQQQQQSSSSPEEEVILSPACISRIKKANELVQKPDRYLRVIIGPGGCSGFMTEFQFDEERKDEDVVIEQDGVKVLLDDISLRYLRGSTIDWEDTLAGSQFFIRDNPQAVNGCSCGVSFDVKDEEEDDLEDDDELG